MATTPITIVMGGQFGSEGKGEVVSQLAEQMNIKHNQVSVVRVGGPQAGHSVTFQDGRKIAVCQIPVGFHIPTAKLFIGPGSEVDPDKLLEEYQMLEKNGWDVANMLSIDPRATILTRDDKDYEKHTGMTERLGSTAKGIGSCRSRRILRTAHTVRDCGIPIVNSLTLGANPPGSIYADNRISTVPHMPYPNPIIIETAQGFGLSLTTAGCYPFCTSTDIVPGRAMADAGLSSRLDHRVVMVVRTYPIRVHGNSGPMNGELTWEELYTRSKGRSPQAGELTTVTKKTRRICEFDWDLFDAAVTACRPDAIVVTFGDYLAPDIADKVEYNEVIRAPFIYRLVEKIERRMVPVVGIATGAGKIAWDPQFQWWFK